MRNIYNLNSMFSRIPTHLIVAGSAWISRILTAMVSLISVRILTDGLGTEQYTVFVLLTGLMGWYLLSDLGLGTSLQNYISECKAKGKSPDEYMVITTFFAVILLLLTIVLLYFISPILAPLFLKQYDFLSKYEKIQNFFVVGSLYIGVCIGGISYKVWYAQLKGYLSNIIPGIASLLTLSGIIFVTQSQLTNKLYWCLLVYVAPSAILALVSYIKQLAHIPLYKWKFDRKIFKSLLMRGIQFWFFSLLAAIVLQIDYIVMSQFISAQDIVVYTITSKIFVLVFFVYNSIIMALWPLYTQMIIKNDWIRALKYAKKYIALGIVFMVSSTIVLVWLMPTIVSIISPSTKVVVPVMFILVLGMYFVIRIWTDTFAMILQSVSKLSIFWKNLPMQALLSFGLQWLLAPRFGIYGIIIALISSYVLTVAWSLPLAFQRQIKTMKERSYEH